MRQLLQKIREMDGEGTLAEMRFLEETAEQAMVEQFSAQARSGYDRVIRRGMELMQKKPDSRELGRLQRDLEQAQRQDYFHTGLTGELRGGLEQLLHAAGESVHEFADAFGSCWTKRTTESNRTAPEILRGFFAPYPPADALYRKTVPRRPIR